MKSIDEKYSKNKLSFAKYSSLLISLSVSDLRIRYRNSFLGFVWSFLEPLLILGVLYFVFKEVFPSNSIPNYPLFLLLGLIVWNVYTRSTTSSLNSFIAKKGIVSKVYFPREILPLAACITSFMMMAFELAALGVFFAFFQFIPPLTILYFPIILIILFILCLGISFLLSVANVYFRDMQYIWGVILQAGFFVTPIFYNLSVFPEATKDILLWNPVASILDMAHSVVLYNNTPSLIEFGYTTLISLAILGVSYALFRKYQSKAVELL